ncbi:hypothetical protein P152DRAFT_447755 [Eremomyces bilateralis CBS 781.70]|uniref:Uncharacterized protein n=1 Tax=Eremomyces bilateralis CBS 781.70 TaxID=1392243 RepID=A0A6G1G8J0_9PEZI|nr:uncharacterized protein P152DRAFT_447755 [Eremomyces bilateralis CBS 781.70]KAF1814387.1 hypothetical protein P152DRAFT_447755 [Eremomyces bilateralis CBS 781.70]
MVRGKEHIEIDVAELDSWDAPLHGVPSRVYERLRRDEPSAQEKARTGQVVPSTERGLDEGEAVDIREVLATLGQGDDIETSQEVTEEMEQGDATDRDRDRVLGDAAVPVHETSSSGIFALDKGPDIANGEKLQYVRDALGQQDPGNKRRGGTAEVRRWNGAEPYIVVNRGEDFADPFDARFFAKTFPTLFPLGRGGPLQADKSIQDVAGARDRHGGRFALYHIFPFLVFNVGVRSRNRRASMASVARKDFPAVECIALKEPIAVWISPADVEGESFKHAAQDPVPHHSGWYSGNLVHAESERYNQSDQAPACCVSDPGSRGG